MGKATRFCSMVLLHWHRLLLLSQRISSIHITWKAYDSSLPDEDIAIYVSAGGSGQGTKAVIDGTSTFGMVARSVKDEEKKAIKDEKEYQVGIDALTIAVNPENPVTKIIDDLSTGRL